MQSGVEMNDIITTANAKAGITFRDDTKVQITEHSKLVIDTFVYDGEKKTGKLGIKMALGTVKYASGQIAKSNPQQVVVETPTATIGVRGTDFSGTVDETGRSTIILLPSCPVGWRNIIRDCVVGSISVRTDMGTVVLTRPFESVTIDTSMDRPRPMILNLSLDQINNLLIVSPPKEIKEANSERRELLDTNFLDKDLLNYDGLDKDLLKYDKLSRNLLDVDFLFNFLDVTESQRLGNELSEFDAILPKYDPRSGIRFSVQEELNRVTISRESLTGQVEITVSSIEGTTINISQDSVNLKQVVNNLGTTTITVRQSR
jgi:hypothetical protein